MPTSQPLGGASGVARLGGLGDRDGASSESTAPEPSDGVDSVRDQVRMPGDAGEVACHAAANRIARQPSGHDFSVALVSWMSAVHARGRRRGHARAAHRQLDAVTPSPLAAISGSSRSLCVDARLRKTESLAATPAVSLWLPTVRLL